jgi:hypothetical protein
VKALIDGYILKRRDGADCDSFSDRVMSRNRQRRGHSFTPRRTLNASFSFSCDTEPTACHANDKTIASRVHIVQMIIFSPRDVSDENDLPRRTFIHKLFNELK